MALPTFVSQNLGAGEYERAKKGAYFGIASGMAMAEAVGVILYMGCGKALRLFVDSPEAIRFGVIHGHTVTLFFFLLAFSQCAAGVMRGCGKSDDSHGCYAGKLVRNSNPLCNSGTKGSLHRAEVRWIPTFLRCSHNFYYYTMVPCKCQVFFAKEYA